MVGWYTSRARQAAPLRPMWVVHRQGGHGDPPLLHDPLLASKTPEIYINTCASAKIPAPFSCIIVARWALAYRRTFKTFREKRAMVYVITEPCIGVKDAACVDVCPVDCIHPTRNEPGFALATQLYIDPGECICCGGCEPECPVGAIF